MAKRFMTPLRLGFIGAGVMATWAIYPALHFAPVELHALCDLDEGRAREAAGKFGARRWYTDFRQMLAQEDLEALIIQMHPAARQTLVQEALAAGCHVFIPKPPAMSLVDTIALAEAAERTGKILMVNFQRRFSFGVSQARMLMAAPSFGRLTQLHCSFCSGRYDAVRGAGYDGPLHAFLLDFSVHHLDLARYLGGEVQGLALFHNHGGDADSFAISLQFTSGAVGTLQLNSQRIWWRNYDHIELTGEGEYIVLDGLWSIRHYTQDGNTFTENYSDERSGELTGDGHALNEFVAAIREAREPIANIQDCVKTMRLYQTIYDAVREERSGVIPIDAP
jgi:myo-inositol 2-dehydrogenase/D-chiro-inositol 1-dehydrogenase